MVLQSAYLNAGLSIDRIKDKQRFTKDFGAFSEAAREPNQSSSDLAFDFALVASLSEGGVGRLLLAADGRSVALLGAVSAPNRARGKSRGRT